MKTKELKKDLYWIGNLDPDLRVFDIIMTTEFGTSYNSYALKGSEKNVIFEASKAKCFKEYLEKLTEILPLRKWITWWCPTQNRTTPGPLKGFWI